MRYYLPVQSLETIWEPASALGRNNTGKVSQDIKQLRSLQLIAGAGPR